VHKAFLEAFLSDVDAKGFRHRTSSFLQPGGCRDGEWLWRKPSPYGKKTWKSFMANFEAARRGG